MGVVVVGLVELGGRFFVVLVADIHFFWPRCGDFFCSVVTRRARAQLFSADKWKIGIPQSDGHALVKVVFLLLWYVVFGACAMNKNKFRWAIMHVLYVCL